MPQILLTHKDPALVFAALQVIPSADVYQGREWPELGNQQAWCFIDWLLDDLSGLELCRQIRGLALNCPVHITIVVDGSDPSARERAIAAGADDYMIGPLTPQSLIKRLQAYGCGTSPETVLLSSSGLAVYPEAHQARWHGRLIRLSPNDLRLLQIFLVNRNRLMARNKIIELLGKEDNAIDERTVDVWVGRLRRRLEAAGATGLLRTVRSMGYVFDTPEI